MTNRRDFLKLGMATAAITFTAPAHKFPVCLTRTEELSVISPYKILFDGRYPDSRAFAGELVRRGIAVEELRNNGNVTDFWYHDLYHQWLRKPVAIAGLTSPDSLFCLELLAADRKMHVIYRAEHRYLADDRIQHRGRGTDGVLAQLQDAAGSGNDWSRRLAGLVTNCPPANTGYSGKTCITDLTTPAKQRALLVSWVIAPVQRTRAGA